MILTFDHHDCRPPGMIGRMRFPTGLRALNHHDFRRFLGAQVVSQLGSWMQSVAQSWLVLELTNSPFRLGLLGALQFGPFLFLSPVSGAIVDRLPRRRLLIVTQILFALQSLGLALLVSTGHGAYWAIALLATMAGFANTLDQPARQAFVTALVGRADVLNAVVLTSAAFNATRIVGPAAAGLLIGQIGIAPAFVVNALSFLVVVLTLVRLAEPARPARSAGTSVLDQIGEGVAYAWRTPRVRLFLGLLFTVSFTVFNFSVYVPVLARTVLGLGPAGFGLLMTALGVGAVLGALTLGMASGENPSIMVVFAAATVACGGLLGLSLCHRVWTTASCLVVTGFFGVIVVASCNTALQLAAPDALRGRVLSLYTWVYFGLFPIGAFLIGAVSERWGVSRALFVAGLFGLATLAVVGGWWRRGSAG
ncbi:MAG: MFS transporter [Candidatus Rokuibacteriota bacterium]|nr:MAG: MFS transporter [Candidatus Rokubacteria bacterium]